MNYFAKFKGSSQSNLVRPKALQLAFIWLGSFLAIASIVLLADVTQQPLILGSFGASCFIIFIAWDTPFAQPRNVIGGHFFSSLVGLFCFHFIGDQWWSMALALATALSLMQLLKVSHPPAGSNPIIVFLSGADWPFLWTPTFIGSVLLVTIAIFYNNLDSKRSYPTYWK